MTEQRRSWLAVVGPGIAVAATGVGAGDLITASLAGSHLGVAILWAAVVGSLLKYSLNEGIARWQMATGTTLLEGWVNHLGRWIQWVFVAYFLVWSFAVGGALASACGIAGTGLLPLGSPDTSRVMWGVIHSLLGLALVWFGGYRLFEWAMAGSIAAMFVGVVLTAVLLRPDWGAVGRGLVVPQVPAGGVAWVLGVLGGVGGTVTLLSYGYWVRERDRSGAEGLRTCRLDLAVSYAMTALFGLCMVVIGSHITLEGKGAKVALQLADQLGAVLGPVGRWLFLVGFWGAVWSSLLGVWQSAPYLFADFLRLRRGEPRGLDLAHTPAYRGFLVAIALVPLVLLVKPVQQIQLLYAVLGSLFMPLAALTLLLLNTRERLVGRAFRNGWLANLLLLTTLAVFAYLAAVGVRD